MIMTDARDTAGLLTGRLDRDVKGSNGLKPGIKSSRLSGGDFRGRDRCTKTASGKALAGTPDEQGRVRAIFRRRLGPKARRAELRNIAVAGAY